MNAKANLHKSIIRLVLVGFLGILPIPCGFSWAVEPVVSSTDAAPIPGRVLVRIKEGIPLEQVQQIAGSVGAEVERVLAPWGLYLFRFDESVPVEAVIQQLQSRADVEYAEPDARIPAAGLFSADEPAPSGQGGPVIVAVIDTGMDLRHPVFADRLYVNSQEIAGDGIDNDGNGYIDDVHGYDFYGQGLVRDPGDGDPSGGPEAGAHGTQVAGRVLQGASDSGVSLMALRVGPGPWLTLSGIVQAIYYAVDQGARVINMSFSTLTPYRVLQDAVQYAASRGVLMVAAAGNDGGIPWLETASNYPAAFDNVISVAASDASRRKAGWSNYGSTVDFTAPGEQVTTTTFGGGTAQVSGTSFSAPFVAGVAARILAALPELTPAQVIGRLMSFMKNIYAANPQYLGGLGLGLIDDEVAQRVAEALPLEPPAPEEPPDPDRAQLEAERDLAQQEVDRLTSELSAAEQDLAAAHERVVGLQQGSALVDQKVRDAWREYILSWRGWYRFGFSGPTSPQQREELRQRQQEALRKWARAMAERSDLQARLRAAVSEESRLRSARNDLAARLRSAQDRLNELNQQLAGSSVQQAQTQSFLTRMHRMLDSLQAPVLPTGLKARVVSEPLFPEAVSLSTTD